MTSYLAPTYFPPAYFALVGGSGTLSGGVEPPRDRDVYQAMMDELKATGEFSEIVLMGPDGLLESADLNPVLGVMPRGWQEVEDGDAGSLIRAVQYQLWIMVKEQDAFTRFDWSDRLACLVQNLLDGGSMGGTCIASLSVLRRGAMQATSVANSLTLVLQGQFAYGINQSVGRGTGP